MEIDLIVFDLDGTLVDTRQDLTDAVNYALKRLGKPPLDVDTVTRNVGDGVRMLLLRTLQIEDDALRAKGRDYFIEYYSQHLADHTRPYPGIIEMLDTLKGFKMAVLTNKSQEFTEPLLRQIGLDRYFVKVIGGNAGYPAKPDPQGLQAILSTLEVPAEKAIMIGDSGNDIHVGKALGVKTCAVSWGYRPLDELKALQPDFIAESPQDIIHIVQNSPV